MHAGIRLGGEYFTENGYTVVAVSRPGYGKTPLDTGETPEIFASALQEMLTNLGIERVTVIGISAGGRTALCLASLFPDIVDRLILQSSVSFDPWPDRMTRIAARLAFNPGTERYTWALIHRLFRARPRQAAAMMLSNMTNLNAKDLVGGLDDTEIRRMVDLFSEMRSGQGFMNDLRSAGGDACGVRAPTLIIHSRHDASVPIGHAASLSQQIPHARLFISDAESHLIWLSPHYTEIRSVMDEFLSA